MNKPIKQRLLERSIAHKSGCRLWIDRKHIKGYGIISIGRKEKKAHRVSYETYIGPIPEGLHVCHRCDVPACINPDHLFLGTNADNAWDSASKLRQIKKLSVVLVEAIRADSRAQRQIAKDYNICQATVSEIKRNLIWRHI